MKLIWNFVVLIGLLIVLFYTLNQINRCFGFPDIINLWFVDDALKAVFGALTNR